MSKCECKECLHYDVCCEWITKESVDNINKVRKGKLSCPHYKDKSPSVYIPCKVGDTVYEIRDTKIFKEKIVEMKVVAIAFLVSSCCKKLSITAENSRGANLLLENEDFGKTVFLTKEEAENKLKEMG